MLALNLHRIGLILQRRGAGTAEAGEAAAAATGGVAAAKRPGSGIGRLPRGRSAREVRRFPNPASKPALGRPCGAKPAWKRHRTTAQ